MILCVVMVSLGGLLDDGDEKEIDETEIPEEEEEDEDRIYYIIATLCFAKAAGFALSLNSISIQYGLNSGFPVD